MVSGKNKASPFYGADTGTSAAVRLARSLANFNKHQCAVTRAHHQINFAATTPRCPIIARQLRQACFEQVCESN